MYYAEVIGTVWATQKHPSLVGTKLQFIQPLDFSGNHSGSPIVAIDTIGAGKGERVIYVTSSEAVIPLKAESAPVDASIVGIVSRVDMTNSKGN